MTIEIVIVVGGVAVTDVPITAPTGDLRIGAVAVVVVVEVDLIDVIVGKVVAAAAVEIGPTIIEATIAMTIEDIVEAAVVAIAVIEISAMNEIAVTTEDETKIEVIIGIFGTATATDVEKINVVRIAGCHKDKRMKNI